MAGEEKEEERKRVREVQMRADKKVESARERLIFEFSFSEQGRLLSVALRPIPLLLCALL